MYYTHYQLQFRDVQDCLVKAEIMTSTFYSGNPIELAPADNSLLIQEDDNTDYLPIRKATGYIRIMAKDPNVDLSWLPYNSSSTNVIRITRESVYNGLNASELLFIGALDYEVCEFDAFNYPQEIQCNFHDLLTDICDRKLPSGFSYETTNVADYIRRAFVSCGFEQFIPDYFKFSNYVGLLGPLDTRVLKDAWYLLETDNSGIERRVLQLKDETWRELIENLARRLRKTFSLCGDTLYITNMTYGNHGLVGKDDFIRIANGLNPQPTTFVSQPPVYLDITDVLRIHGDGHKISMHSVVEADVDNIINNTTLTPPWLETIQSPSYQSPQQGDYIWSKNDSQTQYRPRIMRVFGLNRWYGIKGVFASNSNIQQPVSATVKAHPFDKTVAVKYGGRLYRILSRRYNMPDGRTECVMIEQTYKSTFNQEQDLNEAERRRYADAIANQINPIVEVKSGEHTYWSSEGGLVERMQYGSDASILINIPSGNLWVDGREVPPTEVVLTEPWLGRLDATQVTIGGVQYYEVANFWQLLESSFSQLVGRLVINFNLHINYTTYSGKQLVGTGAIPVNIAVTVIKNGDMPVSALPTSLEWGMDNPAYRSSEYRVWKRIMHYNRSSILTILTGVDYEGKFYAADRVVVHNANAIAEYDFELAINEYGEAQFEITQAAKMDNSETPPGVTPKVYDHYWSIQGYAEYNTQEGLKQVPFEIFITFNPQP